MGESRSLPMALLTGNSNRWGAHSCNYGCRGSRTPDLKGVSSGLPSARHPGPQLLHRRRCSWKGQKGSRQLFCRGDTHAWDLGRSPHLSSPSFFKIDFFYVYYTFLHGVMSIICMCRSSLRPGEKVWSSGTGATGKRLHTGVGNQMQTSPAKWSEEGEKVGVGSLVFSYGHFCLADWMAQGLIQDTEWIPQFQPSLTVTFHLYMT